MNDVVDKSSPDSLFGAMPSEAAPAAPVTTEVSPAATNTELVRQQALESNPLAGHKPFTPSNRGHVDEPIVVVPDAAAAPAQTTTAEPGQVPAATTTAAPVTQPTQQQVPEGFVPVATHIEERRKMQAREEAAQAQVAAALAQNAQMLELLQRGLVPQQQQQQPVEEEINPEVDLPGYLAQMERRQQAQLAQVVNHFQTQEQKREEQARSAAYDKSQQEAAALPGQTPETVQQAYDAAKAAGLLPSFAKKASPYVEIVKWHKAVKVAELTGGDLAAYEAQIEARAREKLLAELKLGKAPPANIPPAIGVATSAASGQEVVKSSNGFFNDMINSRPTPQGHGARA